MVGYLNITGLDLALLLNFKNARLEWKRVLRPREPGEHDKHDLHALGLAYPCYPFNPRYGEQAVVLFRLPKNRRLGRGKRIG
jgi:hypothetical protein